jgi:hypothetical protein
MNAPARPLQMTPPQQPPPQQPPQHQQALPLPVPEPTEAEILAEARRMWLARGYWRAQYRSFEALMAEPRAGALMRRVARATWLQRLHQVQHQWPRRAQPWRAKS